MREFSEHEKTVIRLCHEKYGASERDELFFLDSGEAIFQVWANGHGPWVHLTNIGSWIADGSISEAEAKESQL